MARRGENIRKRKDGRWEGRYVAYDKKNKKVMKSVYAKTYKEVRKKLAETKLLISKEEDNKVANCGENFWRVTENWLHEQYDTKKYATYIKYKNVVEKHLFQIISVENPFALDALQLENLFWNYKNWNQLSESTQKSIIGVFNRICEFAHQQYGNPYVKVNTVRTKHRHKPVYVLTQSEQANLIRNLYIKMDCYGMGIILCLSTGLRLGELCALKWQDIDKEHKLLRVNRTVQRLSAHEGQHKTVLMEGTPKSEFSKREIPIPETVLKLILQYGQKGEYVIGGGKPVEPRTYQNKWKRYLTACGIEEKNFHILRHTFATNCIAQGMDAKCLSELLGHSDVKITLNRYVHPAMTTKRKYMDSLSAFYGQYMGQTA